MSRLVCKLDLIYFLDLKLNMKVKWIREPPFSRCTIKGCLGQGSYQVEILQEGGAIVS